MRKNKFIVKKIVVMLIMAAIFFLIGCENGEDSRLMNLNLRSADDDLLHHLTELQLSDMKYWTGYEFGINLPDLELEFDEVAYGVFELVNTTDYLVANFTSIASHDFYFIFKVFINYEEAAFRVKGENKYTSEFLFLLESGYQIDIPFTLELEHLDENETLKLTAGVFLVDSNQVINEENHAVFNDMGFMGMALNHDLIIGSDSEINFEFVPNTKPLGREEATNFIDLLITPELKLNEFGVRARPGLVMQVTRGETTELFFETTPHVPYGYELENYLIIGMLNGQQIPLNGNPFLFVEVNEHAFNHITDHGSFTLEGLDEVGYHDFITLLIVNPENRNSVANSVPLFISNRIIIEVVE